MTQLTVDLTEEQVERVSSSVARGYYTDASSFVREAVERLQIEDARKLAALRKAIQEGFDCELIEGDAFEIVAKEMGWELDD